MHQIETLTDLRPTLVFLGIAQLFKYISTIIDDNIVTMGQSMGLVVEADDTEKLLEDNSIELTTIL